MIKTIHIINGPNLNLLGRREPELYGSMPFEVYFESLIPMYPHLQLTYKQSNHEGTLMDWLHETGFNPDTGIVMNPGGYAHTSIALRDAVAAIPSPVVEVHITAIETRETFRRHSFMTEVCYRHFSGFGLEGYRKAIDSLLGY